MTFIGWAIAEIDRNAQMKQNSSFFINTNVDSYSRLILFVRQIIGKKPICKRKLVLAATANLWIILIIPTLHDKIRIEKDRC